MDDDFVRREEISTGMNRSRCIGCWKIPLVGVKSKYCRGWCVCADCARTAVAILERNSNVIQDFMAEDDA